MPKDMYNGIMGWKEVQPGEYKKKATHKLLTNEEYNQIIEENNKLRESVEYYKYISEITTKEAQEKLRQTTNKAEEKTRQAMDLYEQQKNLNQNLIKVARERANRARKIPKKGEGYIVTGKYEKQEKWIIKIITPWDVGMQQTAIDTLVIQDIRKGVLQIAKQKTQIREINYYANAKTGFWEATLLLDSEPEISPKHRQSKYA